MTFLTGDLFHISKAAREKAGDLYNNNRRKGLHAAFLPAEKRRVEAPWPETLKEFTP
jgi:hypothetical protein